MEYKGREERTRRSDNKTMRKKEIMIQRKKYVSKQMEVKIKKKIIRTMMMVMIKINDNEFNAECLLTH